MSLAKEQAEIFATQCRTRGVRWEIVNPSVLRIRKNFTPGDKEGFSGADAFGEGILGLAPLRGGSVWGTDGGSIGGMAGLMRGEYVLNKSGEGSRFMKALAKVNP